MFNYFYQIAHHTELSFKVFLGEVGGVGFGGRGGGVEGGGRIC